MGPGMPMSPGKPCHMSKIKVEKDYFFGLWPWVSVDESHSVGLLHCTAGDQSRATKKRFLFSLCHLSSVYHHTLTHALTLQPAPVEVKGHQVHMCLEPLPNMSVRLSMPKRMWNPWPLVLFHRSLFLFIPPLLFTACVRERV